MKLNEIRNMSDEELKNYLNNLSGNKLHSCPKCGSLVTRKSVIIYNKDLLSQKKLCYICDKCYLELLNFLNVSDVFWE